MFVSWARVSVGWNCHNSGGLFISLAILVIVVVIYRGFP
jgi:hypothetical protein